VFIVFLLDMIVSLFLIINLKIDNFFWEGGGHELKHSLQFAV